MLTTNADVRPQSSTLGHYSEHVNASVASGARHLGQESTSNATHSILSRSAGMPSVPSTLPKPTMSTAVGDVMSPVRASALPRGSTIM